MTENGHSKKFSENPGAFPDKMVTFLPARKNVHFEERNKYNYTFSKLPQNIILNSSLSLKFKFMLYLCRYNILPLLIERAKFKFK